MPHTGRRQKTGTAKAMPVITLFRQNAGILIHTYYAEAKAAPIVYITGFSLPLPMRYTAYSHDLHCHHFGISRTASINYSSLTYIAKHFLKCIYVKQPL